MKQTQNKRIMSPHGKAAPAGQSAGAQKRRTPTRKDARREEPLSTKARLIDRFNTWRLGLTVDPEAVGKSALLGLLIVVFTLLQTTLFTRFRPFGAVPDLLLPFVIVVGIKEKEKWGAVCGLIAAFVIDAAGGTEVTLLPLLYVPAAFACGILTTNRLRDSVYVNAVYTVSSSFLRGIITFVVVLLTVNGITPGEAIVDKVIPEFFANILLSPLPQLLTRAVLRPFHKTREERTGGRSSL